MRIQHPYNKLETNTFYNPVLREAETDRDHYTLLDSVQLKNKQKSQVQRKTIGRVGET